MTMRIQQGQRKGPACGGRRRHRVDAQLAQSGKRLQLMQAHDQHLTRHLKHYRIKTICKSNGTRYVDVDMLRFIHNR